MTKKKKTVIIAVAVLLFIAIVTAGICIGINVLKQKPEPAVGVAGRITDGWDVGSDDADSKPSGGTQIPGYSTAEMNEGDTELHLSIGNPKSNTCGFYATLKLEDGTVLYKSELLPKSRFHKPLKREHIRLWCFMNV